MVGRIAGIPPTKQMQISARQGLQLQQEYGRGQSKRRLETAQLIAQGESLSESQWRNISSFHARYYGDSDPQQLKTYENGGPDARYIAALLMGGNGGQDKAFDLIPELNRN
ncbi:hypothetical protein K9N68_37300 (plasmid) [Kovacikia minuta CCNUW1]|uniref:hypothetical protein n=1 Tax=Kovacikia minuta TaxID=2931930 RepID=UPI001CCDF482|nr:hypothetical protein [Kovacikia minuta]UBF29870.1 hypothetical protein K9N68_37300 [Kovacikia minuta CCNUW1]